jgi:excisionase family DNA binding protein
MRLGGLYTAKDFGRFCGVANQTAVNWIRQGLIPAAVTPGGKFRIRRQDIVEFMRSRGYQIPPELGPEAVGGAA